MPTTTTSTSTDDTIIYLTVKPHVGAFWNNHSELTPPHAMAMATALAERQATTPYTVWITEAWRVLGWAEPTAALFWEMATLYHALYWKQRTMTEDKSHNNSLFPPPILSCGSTASLGSVSTHQQRKQQQSEKELPVWVLAVFLLLHCRHENATQFVLQHLRHFLILIALPDHPEAVKASWHLAALPVQADTGTIGSSIRLSLETLERLWFLLQPPRGGGMEDPPLSIGTIVWQALYQSEMHLAASILLGDVEHELRRHLEHTLPPSTDIITNGDEDYKEIVYRRVHDKTILWKQPNEQVSSGASLNSGEPRGERTHDVTISECENAHIYLLQPLEHATIANCSNCTVVLGAVAGLLHIVDCDKMTITCAARKIIVRNCCDVQTYLFSPTPPLLVGDYRSCQFAPYNTYYEGFRDDLVTAGLAVITGGDNSSQVTTTPMDWPALQTASNKWKQPIELAKLEVPQIPGSPSNPAVPTNAAADDKAMESTSMPTPVLLPASDFRVLYVPSKPRDTTTEEEDDASPYCRFLSDVLYLSPFRLPVEYERRVLQKAERMKNVQSALKSLGTEQRFQLEEELNQGFREWLVSSGNLRQVLDLMQMEQVR
jgi:TBCC domain-containing protein 1